MRDTIMDYARPVIIPIPHRIAQTVRVDLYFDAKWMMISEVRFDSGTSGVLLIHIVLLSNDRVQSWNEWVRYAQYTH